MRLNLAGYHAATAAEPTRARITWGVPSGNTTTSSETLSTFERDVKEGQHHQWLEECAEADAEEGWRMLIASGWTGSS